MSHLKSVSILHCTARIVMILALCVEVFLINLSQLFLNKLLQDAALAQEEVTPFHYAWLLILTSFTLWSEPTNYQQVYLLILCRGERF